MVNPAMLLLDEGISCKTRSTSCLIRLQPAAAGKPRFLTATNKACHAHEVVEQAFARWGKPDIVNTDQSSQFTATEFTDTVLASGRAVEHGRAWRLGGTRSSSSGHGAASNTSG